MDAFVTAATDGLGELSGIIWGPFVLIPLLFLTGLYLTIRLGFVQFLRLGAGLHLGLLRRKDDGDAEGEISQFQALTTALAATVGTGNIVGVATAIAVGGPGALFWMWVTGVLGMASKYSEAFLAVRFRTTDDAGEKSGGPQYYLQRGIKGGLGKGLALFFSVAALLACFGIGNMTQGNSIAVNVDSAFGVPTWITGAVLAVMTMVVLVGGIKSIGKVTAGFVPVMIVFYVLGALWILIVNASAIPSAFATIFTEAFTGSAAVGGFTGSAMIVAVQYGMARGIFSNESGMGSAAIAAAAAQTTHPVRQGLVSMTQTFIDTIIVVTCTGLVLITTGTWTEGKATAATMTSDAFATGLPGNWGHWIVTIGLVMFAYSTILGWSYYGERQVERLFGTRLIMPFRVLFSLVVFFGCTTELDLAWTFSDVMNGLMAIPNLLGLLILSGLIARETRLYLKHDPKLVATEAQIRDFMAEDPGYREWLAQEKQLDRAHAEHLHPHATGGSSVR
ncbi:sodium:alanine symporter family protein [Micrococcus porci]|uniref:alanine/glycine:cation symporter family protein n=1 Tax=Micrococcus porci TaxID=2856555 RepID=UPI001CCF2D17|nr:sodium:alanine symporter family protein [Micrococcus porci]UBH24326.1 sodium:alanine symporter family protein [Micrococcus porci]